MTPTIGMRVQVHPFIVWEVLRIYPHEVRIKVIDKLINGCSTRTIPLHQFEKLTLGGAVL